LVILKFVHEVVYAPTKDVPSHFLPVSHPAGGTGAYAFDCGQNLMMNIIVVGDRNQLTIRRIGHIFEAKW
jgi:hypothetical protein